MRDKGRNIAHSLGLGCTRHKVPVVSICTIQLFLYLAHNLSLKTNILVLILHQFYFNYQDSLDQCPMPINGNENHGIDPKSINVLKRQKNWAQWYLPISPGIAAMIRPHDLCSIVFRSSTACAVSINTTNLTCWSSNPRSLSNSPTLEIWGLIEKNQRNLLWESQYNRLINLFKFESKGWDWTERTRLCPTLSHEKRSPQECMCNRLVFWWFWRWQTWAKRGLYNSCGSPPGVNDGWHTELHC